MVPFLYTQRLTTKQAAAKIWQMRTGKSVLRRVQEGPSELYKRLIKTVQDFRVTHPDAPLSYVEEEIRRALVIIDHIRY